MLDVLAIALWSKFSNDSKNEIMLCNQINSGVHKIVVFAQLVGLIFITYLGSRDAVELHIARPTDFGHVQVAAEVEERI